MPGEHIDQYFLQDSTDYRHCDIILYVLQSLSVQDWNEIHNKCCYQKDGDVPRKSDTDQFIQDAIPAYIESYQKE